MSNYKDLEKWWDTEPFGFDNPDTYNGIKKLLEKREKIIKKLQIEIDNIKKKNKGKIK